MQCQTGPPWLLGYITSSLLLTEYLFAMINQVSKLKSHCCFVVGKLLSCKMPKYSDTGSASIELGLSSLTLLVDIIQSVTFCGQLYWLIGCKRLKKRRSKCNSEYLFWLIRSRLQSQSDIVTYYFLGLSICLNRLIFQ